MHALLKSSDSHGLLVSGVFQPAKGTYLLCIGPKHILSTLNDVQAMPTKILHNTNPTYYPSCFCTLSFIQVKPHGLFFSMGQLPWLCHFLMLTFSSFEMQFLLTSSLNAKSYLSLFVPLKNHFFFEVVHNHPQVELISLSSKFSRLFLYFSF